MKQEKTQPYSSLWIEVRLLPGKEKLPRNGHPWIFSGAIEPKSLAFLLNPTALVRVADSRGSFIAWGWVNPRSQIRIRLFSWKETDITSGTPEENQGNTEEIEHLFTKLFSQAILLRRDLGYLEDPQSGCRLVFSESDGLPGIILDKLGSWLILQLETQSADVHREFILKILQKLLGISGHQIDQGSKDTRTSIKTKPLGIPGLSQIKGIVEKSDGDGRSVEGLKPIHQVLWGEPLPEVLEIKQHNYKVLINPQGQKTGFYWDQRENRSITSRLAKDKEVLDVCCFTGGFALEALGAGARSVRLVDSSKDVLELARKNLEANGFSNWELVQEDCFKFLRSLEPESQEMIIFDPPKLAASRKTKDRALAAYKDANLHAIRALKPGGILATFSCSGLISVEEFEQAIFYAAKDAVRKGKILHRLSQAPCHPVLTSFPESRYLKGLLIQW